MKLPRLQKQPKAFAVWWKDLFGFSARATFLSVGIGSLSLGKYPIVLGRDCLAEVRHGSSASPSPKPTGLEILRISAVTRGDFAPAEKKFAFDNNRVRAEFDLRKGDVLMCRTNGTLAYVGMSALVREDMANLVFPDKVIRVRAKENITPEFCGSYCSRTRSARKSKPLRAPPLGITPLVPKTFGICKSRFHRCPCNGRSWRECWQSGPKLSASGILLPN